MKTLTVLAVLTAIGLLFSIKEDRAEAIWNIIVIAVIIGISQLRVWLRYKIRRFQINRIREHNEWMRGRKKLNTTMVIVNEPLTEHEFEVIGN
jgi:hypothetical protein